MGSTSLSARRSSSTTLPVPVVLVVALIASLAIWAVPGASIVLLPVHPYLTFVHESWHALIAVATGGHVSGIHLFGILGGGVTALAGGATLLIASAGYVGSAITGAIFLALLPYPRLLRVAITVQYGLLVAAAILWDHDVNAWIYLVGFGAVLYVLAAKVRDDIFALILGFLALQLALAVLGDLRTLLFVNTFTQTHNDALLAGQISHTPSLLWAALWSVIDGFLLFWSLKSALFRAGRPTTSATIRLP